MNAIIPIGTSSSLLATADHRLAQDMVLSFQNDFEMYEDGSKWSPQGAREALQNTLPSRPVVASALDAIQRDLDTEPPLDKRLEIVGIMLMCRASQRPMTTSDFSRTNWARAHGGKPKPDCETTPGFR